MNTAMKDEPTSPPVRSRRSPEERAAQARIVAERALASYRRKDAAAQRCEARAMQRERKLDTRRKIIAGALALEHAQYDAAFKTALWSLLDSYVDRPQERQLFGLEPRKEIQQASPNA